MTDQSLEVLQHWMKTVITERGSLAEKLQAASQPLGLRIEDIAAEKRGISSHQRLNIYTTGYVLRLLECMRADFPVLRGFVGDSVFDAFAKAYIVTEPPKSPSLFDLGAGFPRFLEETKPKNSSLRAEMIALLDLPPEIARFERARTEVVRARGIEDDPAATASWSPFEILSQDLVLQATPCLRLLELKFSLADFFSRGKTTPDPAATRAPAFVCRDWQI